MHAAVRPYRPPDLLPILQLWERAGGPSLGREGVTVEEAAELLGAPGAITLVAEDSDRLRGAVVAAPAGTLGWVHRLVVAPDDPEPQELARRLLEDVEGALADAGVRRVAALACDEAGRAELERRGYAGPSAALYLERALPRAGPAAAGALAELGAQVVAPGLWDELKGLDAAKEIIERRVILPLAEPELARRHSVAPPRAIVLFGPPGTGKTTFARGIASRLGWPFFEIGAGQLTGEGPEREAKLLAESFERARTDLTSAVVFVDEVEDLAAVRSEERKVSPSITNEFLKQIPRMRELPEHLLVCATNWVGRLDEAFLRPGRFDYVLPVGPPDTEARRAMWDRYVGEITDERVDVDTLVEASELFTAADIEFAARKAAQRAFEREHFGGAAHRATTAEFMAAIKDTRPTLSWEIVEGFEEDVARYARY